MNYYSFKYFCPYILHAWMPVSTSTCVTDLFDCSIRRQGNISYRMLVYPLLFFASLRLYFEMQLLSFTQLSR